MPDDDRSQSAKPEPPESRDVALIHSITPEGDMQVLRRRDDRLEFGAVRPLREGAPIVGEIVRLSPRKEFPLLCDVKTELVVPGPAAAPTATATAGASERAPAAGAPRKGPPQVATEEYRKNWDVIWSRPKARSGLSN